MKGLKHLIWIICSLLFIWSLYHNFQFSKQEIEISHKLLHNNISFNGVIVGIKKSNNHAFGIIELKLAKSNVNDFYRSIDNNEFKGIYPYRIENNIAELYTTISNEIKIGDSVKVVSNDLLLTFNNQKGDLYMISEGYNLDYVHENTKFK